MAQQSAQHVGPSGHMDRGQGQALQGEMSQSGSELTGNAHPEQVAGQGGGNSISYTHMQQAMRDFAWKPDWQCMRSAPAHSNLPGTRYGASMEVQPLLWDLPCPCAGGTWSRPRDFNDSALDSGGLWSFRRRIGGVQTGTSTPISARLAEKHPNDLINWNSAHHHVGTEPYSADFRCAEGYTCKSGVAFTKICTQLAPGRRWYDAPPYAEQVTATPCPCALGIWTGLQAGGPAKASAIGSPATSGTAAADSIPEWQQDAVGQRDATVWSHGIAVALPVAVRILAAAQASARSAAVAQPARLRERRDDVGNRFL